MLCALRVSTNYAPEGASFAAYIGPFGRRIAEPLDADAAGQATFYGGFDKIGSEEGKRDGHVNLPDAAFLAVAKLCDRGYST